MVSYFQTNEQSECLYSFLNEDRKKALLIETVHLDDISLQVFEKYLARSCKVTSSHFSLI